MTIRLVVADDHEVVRKGLASLFENTEVQIVGEASTGEAGESRIRSSCQFADAQPHVAFERSPGAATDTRRIAGACSGT